MIVKKIDMHMHCSDIVEFPGIKGLATPEEVGAMYEKLGVEKGVVLPSGAIPECAVNHMSTRETRAMVQKYSSVIGWWFMPLDPRNITNSPKTDFSFLMQHYMAQGARGISELSANLPLDDPKMMNFFSYCEKFRLPVILHFGQNGWGYGVIDDLHLPRLEKVLATFPNLPVLGHSMAFWTEFGDDTTEQNRHDYLTGPINGEGRAVQLMRKYRNLYADLSAMSGYSALMRDKEFTYCFLEEFQDQIVYATDIATADWIDKPQANLSAFLDDAVESGKISQVAYEKICRKNALGLLKEI